LYKEEQINNKMNNVTNGTASIVYSEATRIGQICFNLLIIIAALLGNSMVIAAVCSTRKLRKPTNYFIVSLAVSDVLIVTTIVPLQVRHYLNYMVWDLGRLGCKILFLMDYLCTAASTTNVALIAIDRFLALSYPFKYQRLVNGKRCAIAIASVWCYAAVLSSLSLTDWSEDAQLQHYPACWKQDKAFFLVVPSLAIFLPLVILIVAYSAVFNLAFRQAMMIKAHSTVRCDTTKTKQAKSGGAKSDKSAQTRMLIRELKATKTLMIVVGTFLVCWLPLFVVLLVQQHCLECISKNLSAPAQQIIGIIFVYTLPRLSSAANPIIYSVFNREFRSVLCVFCDKIARFLPRGNVRDGVVPSRNRAAGFCGLRVPDYTSSTHDSAVTYEAGTDCFARGSANINSRSPSVFTYKSPETCCHETAV
jgi:hypothetical protein